MRLLVHLYSLFYLLVKAVLLGSFVGFSLSHFDLPIDLHQFSRSWSGLLAENDPGQLVVKQPDAIWVMAIPPTK